MTQLKGLSFFWLLLYFLSISFLCAQNRDYNSTFFNKEDGLAQDYIYTTIQDRRGFLWIGTGKGLSRYDGKSIVSYDTIHGLKENFVTASAVDAYGAIVFGHYLGGLSRYDGLKFYPIDYDHFKTKIVDLTTDYKFGLTWGVSQDGKLVKVLADSIEVKEPAILRDKLTNCILSIGDMLYIGTTEGLVKLQFNKEGEIKEEQLDEIFEYINVTSFYKGANNLWIGTDGDGIYKYDLEQKTVKGTKLFEQRFDEDHITSLFEDYDKNLWMGTKFNGAIKLSLNKKQNAIINTTYFNESSNYPNSINSIYEDKEGDIWLGTIGFGLVQLVKNNFSEFDLNKQLGVNVIYSGISTGVNNFLFGTDIGLVKGVYNFDINTYSYNLVDSTQEGKIEANILFHHSNGDIWIGTNDRVYIYDEKAGSIVPYIFTKDKESPNHIRSIEEDKEGNMWVSVAGHGVYKLNADYEIVDNLNTSTGFIHNDIFAIHIDQQDNIWFGAKGAGLALLNDEDSLLMLSQKGYFNSRDVNHIIGAQNGHVWIATDGNGLFEYNDSSFVAYSAEMGLFSNYCGKLTDDIDGDIWVTHRNGISKISAGSSRRNKVVTYSQDHDIYKIDAESNVVFSDTYGGVWFGSRSKLLKYNPASKYDTDESLKTYITELRFFYQTEDLSQYSDKEIFEGLIPDNINLPYDKNHITFDFIAISLKKQNSVYYKHKMVGYEGEWSPPSHDNSITYTNLQPGEYTIQIIASDNLYSWDDSLVMSYKFNIEEPYWQTWWFNLIQVIILMSLFFITYQLSIYSKNRKRDIWILRLMIYVSLFVVFEFIQDFSNPYIKLWIGGNGEPVYRLLFNLVLAILLFPIEGLIKKYFASKKKANE